MVKQYLEQNGQWSPEVADMLITNPDDPMFTEALAAIQQKGTVPDVDPNQPPPPMGPPPGGAPPPGGGAPPGAGGPPGQTQMMQASRTAADNLAKKCPFCASNTTSLDTEDGLCHCHACGKKFQMPQEEADTIHSSAMENTWITQDGQNLAPGMKVLMFSSATPIPDEVTITDVKPNSIVYKLEGSFGLDHETEITRQEAQIDGLTFAIDPSQQGDQGMMEHEPPAIEPNTNDDNTGFVGPGEGTTNLAVQSSEHRFCANCESPHQTGIHEAHANLCRSCAFDLDYGNGLNKTAGADFSRSEQLSFINEPGVARNLSDLKLEGTHYQEIDTEDLLFW
jgi:ribosomal protein L37AE/L43A